MTTTSYLPLILTAFVAVFTSITAPLLLIYLSNRQRRKEREEDWARQDAQAAKVERMAAEVGVVKTLVNGEKTAAMQRELHGHVRQRTQLERLVKLTERAGEPVDPKDRAELAAVGMQITELEAEIEERHRYFELAQQQMDANPVFEDGETP